MYFAPVLHYLKSLAHSLSLPKIAFLFWNSEIVLKMFF